MKKLLVLALLPMTALAGSFTATWVHPTTNTDGSALPLSQITSTRVEWGSCSGSAFGIAVGQVVVPGPATTVTVNNVAAGPTCIHAATTANGNEGAWSVVQQKVIPAPTPNPPTLTVTVAAAYSIYKGRDNRLYAYYVGKARIGAPCTTDVQFGSYYRISAKDVKLVAPPTSIIVARCA